MNYKSECTLCLIRLRARNTPNWKASDSACHCLCSDCVHVGTHSPESSCFATASGASSSSSVVGRSARVIGVGVSSSSSFDEHRLRFVDSLLDRFSFSSKGDVYDEKLVLRMSSES